MLIRKKNKHFYIKLSQFKQQLMCDAQKALFEYHKEQDFHLFAL